MAKRQHWPTLSMNNLCKKSSWKVIWYQNIKRRTSKLRIDWNNSSSCMSLFDQIEILIAKTYLKLRTKLLRPRDDIKSSTIRSISSRNKFRQKKLHWLKNISSTRRRIKLYSNIVDSLKRRKNRWTLKDKWSRISTMKSLSCTPALSSYRPKGSTKKMNINLFLLKEISWVLSLSEETINQPFCMKR